MVLLIDDDLVSREVTATLLTMTGYNVHTADSGEQREDDRGGDLQTWRDPDGRADARSERRCSLIARTPRRQRSPHLCDQRQRTAGRRSAAAARWISA